MRKQIEELLDLQLIERSGSHYSCSAFLIRNHSEIVRGKDRMVINYKPLNAITKSFHYPLRRQETIMQKIQGSKIFSKFDMKSGYYQVQIREEDRQNCFHMSCRFLSVESCSIWTEECSCFLPKKNGPYRR